MTTPAPDLLADILNDEYEQRQLAQLNTAGQLP